jgi:hypothetical protein
MQQVKYAIVNKKTGEMLTYYTSSNSGGDCCVDVQYVLWESKYDPVWYHDNEQGALYVLSNDTKWYNADIDTPSHGKDISPETHKVVKVTITHLIEDI